MFDGGVHTFAYDLDLALVLKTAGTQWVRATDTANSSITGTQTGIVVNPAAAKAHYASAADHFSLSYPSTWKLSQLDTATLGKVEASVAAIDYQVAAPDQFSYFNVYARHSATDGAAIKAKVIAWMQESRVAAKAITFSTVTINGVKYLDAFTTIKVDATHQAEHSILATSHGKFTYYLGPVIMLNQSHTKQERAQLTAILASFKPT